MPEEERKLLQLIQQANTYLENMNIPPYLEQHYAYAKQLLENSFYVIYNRHLTLDEIKADFKKQEESAKLFRMLLEQHIK